MSLRPPYLKVVGIMLVMLAFWAQIKNLRTR